MVLHYSRTSPIGNQPRYLASTAVFLVEIVKLVTSLVLAIYDTFNSNPSIPPSQNIQKLYNSLFSPDSWKLVVPAALYTLQNSLVYVAISNLDPVTYQVTYQLKILTTVLFSILLLGKIISSRQWMALILLTFGVAMVQLAEPLNIGDWRERLNSIIQGKPGPVSSTFKGLVAVVAASMTSGLTCVYFEKLLKDSGSQSLWTRNVQLSFFSLFPALFIGVLWKDGAAIGRDGFFAGYNAIVWFIILLQAIGGLIVAVCIKYTDNVAKNFAASFSIVVSYAATTFIFQTPVTLHSTVGGSIVLLALYLYNGHSASHGPVLPTTRERHSEKSSNPMSIQNDNGHKHNA
ncbi:nucleotide-sugar transporter-domain-containing protein [Podospora fimiseda]|uniref:Nucleotide-sugar transporter-domain-containing protein n=1 Tax=Podospora fimiseda TaxID=252190 RepID=A0AAN6YL98_9PEZI|nr:nucleotide-sugar transporter-domain-containing protein [Podospora fimiseda]